MQAEVRFVIAKGDKHYPTQLFDLPDAPEMLYVRGNIEALKERCMSIIGARLCTPYGLTVAKMAASIAVESHLAVVSGGAKGCDQAAGRAAIESSGIHIVVLGCGADVAYPRNAKPFFDNVINSGGALVSLDPWGTQPRKWAFPRRNRIIAALSDALLVSEAGLPSGTFSTAEAAVELNRELLAVPGSILSPTSRGSNYLISNGATCIADEEALEVAISRIYGTLRFSRCANRQDSRTNAEEQKLIKALCASPLRGDEIARLLNKNSCDCLQFLSEMMVAGQIERLADGRFSPTSACLLKRQS